MSKLYRNKKNGKHYWIFDESKMKVDGVWIDCYVYICGYHNPEGQVWVRSKEDFENKFEIVNE